ncbi:hypothetical protein RISK_005115 [Rhodopirellula islandica]|uniref:Uncharacterized protein n=1 Tax=Rhodopirellula islandica TaxID=595434 RepID=A0A0J1EB52_RHOIS|nr:hypothetical protein [Rhodopirellula islandica]KLU02819.1 hypothetical protein RISK_005115 [Rhodopirellula islandica]
MDLDLSRRGQFALVLATVRRTQSLPGGQIRGLPNGRVVSGLTGFHLFACRLAEAEKEDQQGRTHQSLDQVNQLRNEFSVTASRWQSLVGGLLQSIRSGQDVKNLERLKRMKAAQVEMGRLIDAAQKAFKDLIANLSNAGAQSDKRPEEDAG